MKYYITVVTGFREDQRIDIPMQEAHKAYYLFKHPEARGVFDNGIALVGKNIQEIRPNWNKTMGWNETHQIGDDDWNEINGAGVGEKMKALLSRAKEVGENLGLNPNMMKMTLGQILESAPMLTEDLQKLLEPKE